MTEVLQTMFNNAYIGILKQGEFALEHTALIYSDTSSCVYKSKDEALKCAIGHSIDNKYYSADLENKGVNTYEVQSAIAASLDVSLDDLDDIQHQVCKLQGIHDNHATSINHSLSIEVWQEDMIKFARAHRLDVPHTS